LAVHDLFYIQGNSEEQDGEGFDWQHRLSKPNHTNWLHK
jgi:hypothetical protein